MTYGKVEMDGQTGQSGNVSFGSVSKIWSVSTLMLLAQESKKNFIEV